MSFGAFGGRRDVMAMFDPRAGTLKHAGTFNNNVVSMAAGVAGCKVLTEARVDGVNALGMLLREKVELVVLRYGIGEAGEGNSGTNGSGREAGEGNGDFGHGAQEPESGPREPRYWIWMSGIGSILHVHFAGPEEEALQELFFHHMLQENIYLAQRGFVALSIEITAEHIAQFVDAVEKFIVKHADLFGGTS